MKPTLLVTGARGFIGRQLLDILAGRFEIHAVSRHPVNARIDDIEWHMCDLMDTRARHALVNGVQASHLVHLAWATQHGEYWSSPDNLDWVASSLMLLREFAEAGGERAVMTGTCAEYDWTEAPPYSEGSATVPETLYGVAKLATGAVSTAFAESSSVSLSWARLFYVYGPGEHDHRLVPSLIRSSLRAEVPTPRNPENVIDLMFVKDAANALGTLLSSDVQGSVNICTGRPIRVSSLASQIAESMGVEAPSESAKLATKSVVGDPSRLRQEVGYKGERELSEGLAATIAWWKLQV